MLTMAAPPLEMTDEQRAQLQQMARSSTLAYRKVNQARGLLDAGDGVANEEIARRRGVDPDAVRRWRNRFAEKGVGGVGAIAQGSGPKAGLEGRHGRRGG